MSDEHENANGKQEEDGPDLRERLKEMMEEVEEHGGPSRDPDLTFEQKIRVKIAERLPSIRQRSLEKEFKRKLDIRQEKESKWFEQAWEKTSDVMFGLDEYEITDDEKDIEQIWFPADEREPLTKLERLDHAPVADDAFWQTWENRAFDGKVRARLLMSEKDEKVYDLKIGIDRLESGEIDELVDD